MKNPFPAFLKKPPGFRAYPIHYIALGIAAFTVLYLLFHFADTMGLKLKYAATRVTGRHFRELSHTTVTSGSGSSLRTHTRAVPPAWMVSVQIDGATGWGQVPPSEYNKMIEGTEVEVVYARKRFTRDLAIQSIRIMRPVD